MAQLALGRTQCSTETQFCLLWLSAISVLYENAKKVLVSGEPLSVPPGTPGCSWDHKRLFLGPRKPHM
jgi:hypothetical protein